MKTKQFYGFWLAKTSIALADVIYIMIITTFIYQKTASATMASLFPLLKAVASLIAGFTSPLLYKRFSFSTLLVRIQGIKAVLLTFLLIGFVPITEHMYSLLLVILLISFMEGWGNPVLNSVLPRIVGKDELVKANSSVSVTVQSVQIAGYSVTGFAVMTIGHSMTLLFNVMLLWIGVFCLYVTSTFMVYEVEENGEKPSKWTLMKEGWVLLWRNKTIRIVTLMDVMEGMAGSIWIGALTLVYVKEVLNQGEQWWGFINASYYVGSIIGGICTFLLAKTIQKHLIVSMVIGSSLFSVFTLMYGLTNMPILALILCVGMGPAYQIRDVAQQTAFQLNIPAEHLPKVYAAQGILLSVMSSISIFLMGYIADVIGIRYVYIIGSVLLFLSALLSFALVQLNKRKAIEVEM